MKDSTLVFKFPLINKGYPITKGQRKGTIRDAQILVGNGGAKKS